MAHNRRLRVEPLEDRRMLANPGDLDLSFGMDGSTMTTFGTEYVNDVANDVAIQADGKIVVVGRSTLGGATGFGHDWALARYNANGSLDTSFSGDGKLTTTFGPADDEATCVAIQGDGKIVVAGQSFLGGVNFDVAIARYHTNGSLDPAFGIGGKLTINLGLGDDFAHDIAIQPDGKIVVVGRSSLSGIDRFTVYRFNVDGSLDTSFSGDGKQSTSFSGQAGAVGVALQLDARIVIGGWSYDRGHWYVSLARYNSDGTYDTSFNGTGRLTSIAYAVEPRVSAMTLQADGKIIVVGASWRSAGLYNLWLARFNPEGSLDISRDFAMSPVFDRANGVVIQPNGKIVAIGYAYNGSDDDLAVARLNENFTLDTSFAEDGKLVVALGPGDDRGQAVAIQADGKIVVAGYSHNGTSDDFAIIRIEGGPGGQPGDFDADGDVDGRDFLAWQRNPSVGSLSDWQGQYGDSELLVASGEWRVEEGSKVGGQGIGSQELRVESQEADETVGPGSAIPGLGMVVIERPEMQSDRGYAVLDDQYVEQVDRAVEQLSTSALLDKPAVAPIRLVVAPFGEMVARRNVRRISR